MKICRLSDLYEWIKRVCCINNSFMFGIFLENSEKNIKMIKNERIKEMAIKLLNNLKAMHLKCKGNFYLIKKADFVISTSGAVTVYIGFSKDGTLVAIQCACKNPDNIAYFKNELNNLRNAKLESKYIIKYVNVEDDDNYIYLAVNIWDYFLEEYIVNLQDDQEKYQIITVIKKMLLGLQVLHQAGVIHGDINPRNVVIDSEGNVRLTGFGRSFTPEDGETTVNTDRGGHGDLEATDVLKENNNTKSSDIKDAGMLLYYILSFGKHRFGDIKEHCWNEKYSLEHLQDIGAKDLIEWMTNKDPEKRPTINEILRHPYFWDKKRKEEVIKKLGDRHEVQYYIDISKACKIKKTEKVLPAEAIERACSKKGKAKILEMLGETEEVQDTTFENLSKLCDYSENYTKGKTFNRWKSELKDRCPVINIDKDTPEDLIGLLRCFRNNASHTWKFDKERFDHFPDFFISLHRLATDMSWDCTWS